ncbi:MAG: tetratricopeptide repeat protein [candidate division WOR-3 bacterium]
MRWSILSVAALAVLGVARTDLKQQAKAAYELEQYPNALRLARQATKANPKDAEAWYLLGRYMHFRCYDSRPLAGFSRATSDSILGFLDRAVKLDPKLGDAFYFIGSEHGVRTHEPLVRGDVEQARAELRAARTKGGYPDWMLEYCRNLLRVCERDAILFVMGDMQVNGVRYLQLVEGERPDVTALPYPLLDRPWAVLLYKDGIPGALRSAPMSWSREQVMDMHPYRWRTDTVRIPVPISALTGMGITAPDTVFEWQVEPDLSNGERPMLSAITAAVIDIVEANNWSRPLYFALCPPAATAGIVSYLQSCGLAQRLLPVRTAQYGLALNTEVIRNVLLDPDSYRNLPSVRQHDMPRVSGVLGMYRHGLIELAAHYAETGRKAACDSVLDQMTVLLPESILPLQPELRAAVERLRSR